MDRGQIEIVDNIAIDRKKRRPAKMTVRQTQAAPGPQLQILELHPNISLAMEHGADLFPQMVSIDHDPLDPAPAELAQGMGKKGGVKHREQRLGTLQGIGAQAGSQPRGKNHGFHDMYILRVKSR